MAVGDEPAEEVNEEIVGTAVAGMLDLTDVFELVVDALDQGAFAEQQLVGGLQDLLTHVLAPLGDEDETLLDEKLLGQRLGDIAAVAKETPKQATHQLRHRAAVIDIARREVEGQQLATIIDEQMQLEALEPADRGLAAPCIHPEDAMLGDPRVVTDPQRGGIDEADAGALAQLGVQIDG